MKNSVKNPISKEEPINASTKAIWYFLILRERELDPKARLFLIHWSLRKSGIIESNDLKSMGTLLDISLAKMQWTIRWASKNNIVENFNIDQKKKRGRPKSSHSLTDNFKNRIRGTQTRQLYQSIILRLLGVAQNEQHLYSLEINPTSELALNHDSRFLLALLFLRTNVAGTVYGVNLEQMSLLTGLSRRNVLKHLQHLQQGSRMSANEHLVPEQFFNDPNSTAKNVNGISAIKALQIAASQGQKIYQISQTNLSTILLLINHDHGTIQDIQNAVAAGKIVMISQTTVTQFGWTGSGYIILDPTTGAGAYLIAGADGG